MLSRFLVRVDTAEDDECGEDGECPAAFPASFQFAPTFGVSGGVPGWLNTAELDKAGPGWLWLTGSCLLTGAAAGEVLLAKAM